MKMLEVSMSEKLAKDVEAVWVHLVRAHTQTHDAVAAALAAEELPPLDWYDVLWELEQAGNEGLRQYELQERLLLPQYGLSRLLDRMVEKRLISKKQSATDRRGKIYVITQKGLKVRARSWGPYAKALSDGLGTRLSRAERVTLARLLSKLHQD